MGDMADYYNEIHEMECQEYVDLDYDGAPQTQYEAGMVNEVGVPLYDDPLLVNPDILGDPHLLPASAYEDPGPQGLSSINAELQAYTHVLSTNRPQTAFAKLIPNDVGSLTVRPKLAKNPTCNVCKDEMHGRNGKFGKFYFCQNGCAGQSTVSDKYWQSVRS